MTINACSPKLTDTCLGSTQSSFDCQEAPNSMHTAAAAETRHDLVLQVPDTSLSRTLCSSSPYTIITVNALRKVQQSKGNVLLAVFQWSKSCPPLLPY